MTKKNITRFLLCSLAATLLLREAAEAGESEWRIYAQDTNGDVHFFDAARLERDADLRLVWTRIRYKTSVMGASSYQSLLELDCSQQTERSLRRTFFSDTHWDVPAMSTDMNAKPTRPIEPGSAAAQLSGILCED